MQTTPGHFNVQANASQIHLEQYATLHIESKPIIQYHALQPLSQVPLNPQTLINSLQSLYLSQKTLSIFRIKAEQEWEFKVPLEEIYVRLAIIESKERRVRDQALDKHSEQLQDDHIPTSETIYESKENIEIEKLFEHKSLEKENAKRIYIQGAAGIGKSTLCHYIAYRWAKEELWQGIFSYLFWIPLRNLTLKKYPADKEYTPADLIAREYAGKIDLRASEACINDATLREKTLLVLDGYDELSAEAQGNTSLATAFKELKELFPHILITSRPGSCSFNRSCELELLGFDKEGVERYIDRFFKQVQAEEKKQKLSHLLQSSPQVLSLAQIPINLTLLCCLFNEDPEVFDSTQSITMTAIYERIVNWMYKWFLLRRIDQGRSSQTKEKILTENNLRYNQEVAKIATAFEEMADFAIKKNTLYLEIREIDHFRGNAITSNELTDCGLLRIPKEKGYFIHLTFQEFLTASKVANQYLQGENRQACQSFLLNYKFEPRYSLVLRMISGYISLSITNNRFYLNLNTNPLQSFFDDLFAEPHDLAVRSELHLIANCFEECQNPAQVKQYEGFIELVKDYMIGLSLLGLNVEELLRNINLLNHPKIMHAIERLLSDSHAIKNMLRNLINLITTGKRLSLEIVRLIVKVLKDKVLKDNEDPHVRLLANFFLAEVAEQGGKLPKEAVDALVQVLKEGDDSTQKSAADALGTVAKQGGEFSKEALDTLVQVLKEGDYIAKEHAADALGTVAKQGGEFSKEAL
ncbi:NACHT domain-containing NTPase, partial [Neochlamydia sp. EPS4]|uniref:NACHT domain-containing protein n=1 Tax=Neochlamydia sp. EPS4 TaxID=1478175 RepID=UPI0005D114FC